MNEIGADFREVRTTSGITLEEVSEDTNIPIIALEQIEEGNIGSFKDIFLLKEYLRGYSKYLGLDVEKVVDKFNEYMFEYTSKIPIESIEQAAYEKELEEKIEIKEEEKAISPYLKPQEKKSNKRLIISIIVIIILVALTLVWAIKQVMLG